MADPTTPTITWIDLDGVVNMRDLGGKPARDGRTTRPGAVIRTDNLQDLPPASVRRLVDEMGVTDIVDLRTDVERAGIGDGPLKAEPLTFHELTLYREAVGSDEHGIPDEATEHGLPDDGDAPDLPWQDDFTETSRAELGHEAHLARHYLGYLENRPDHVLAALRAIAHAPGAVLVHCAAGKDRTGTICALAMTEVGVDREAVVADYDATNQRVERIFARLAATPTYAPDLVGQQVAEQSTPAGTMRRVLQLLDDRFGGEDADGVHAWLTSQGWTDEDHRALSDKLLGDEPATTEPDTTAKEN